MTENKTLSQTGLVAAIQVAAPLSKAKANRLANDILRHMFEALSHHERVTIQRFGGFRVLQKGERMGRNPQTGEEKVISARHVLTFRPSQQMRQRVQRGQR